MGESRRQHIITKQKTIPATTGVVVDSFPYAPWKGNVEYRLTFTEGTKTKTLKLFAYKDDGDVSDQVLARNGDTINLQIGAQLTTTTFELMVTNNENVPVGLSLTRIKP